MVARCQTRFRVLVTGRKFGKTALGALIASKDASDGHRVGWFAPTYKQADEGWEYVTFWGRQVGAKVRDSKRRVDYGNGGRVEVWTTQDEDYMRAPNWSRTVLDEAAFMSNSVWPKVIRPALMATKGKGLIITSPNGRDWVYDLYKLGQDEQAKEWESWRYGSIENPLVTQEEIDSLRPGQPGGLSQRDFDAEVLGLFVDVEGGVFRNVAKCSRMPLESPVPGVENYTFVDLAGPGEDWNALATFRNPGPRQTFVDRWHNVPWDITEARIAEHCKRYPGLLCIDVTGDTYNDPLVERLQDRIGYGTSVQGLNFTNRIIKNMVRNLASKLESNEVQLLSADINDCTQAQQEELQNLEATRLPSGTYRYAAPQGKHDDIAVAVMSACYMASGEGATVADMEVLRHKLGGAYL